MFFVFVHICSHLFTLVHICICSQKHYCHRGTPSTSAHSPVHYSRIGGARFYRPHQGLYMDISRSRNRPCLIILSELKFPELKFSELMLPE